MRSMWVRCILVALLVIMPALSLAPVPPEWRPMYCGISVLDRPLPELSFDYVTMEDVIGFLSDVSDRRFDVDWRALALVGVTRDTPVSGRWRNVRFSKALTGMLDNAAGKPGVLGFEMTRGVIYVRRYRQDPALAGEWALGTALVVAVAYAYNLCSHPRGSRRSRPASV
jgi:hypothetical protein